MEFKIYRVVGPYAGVIGGNLVITPEQARSRAHALEHIEGDTYKVNAPTGFKLGEEFGYDGPMPRTLALNVEESESTFTKALEDMDREELLAFARGLGLNPHPNTGAPKLLDLIQEKQDEMLAEQNQARIAELEAKDPSDLTPEETEELNQLKAQE